MRKIHDMLRSGENNHRQENYAGPLASTNNGGHNANVNNLYNAQVRDAITVMPYGISSRAFSGVKAQAVVNDNSDHVVVGVYDPARPKVGSGEVCLYSSGGCSVYLSSTGVVSITSGNCNIDIDKSMIDISHGKTQMQVKSGDITIKSDNTSIMINSDGIQINSDSAIELKATEDISVETEGKINMSATGNIDIGTEGKTNIQSTGDIDINTDGNINMKCNDLVVNDQIMMVP